MEYNFTEVMLPVVEYMKRKNLLEHNSNKCSKRQSIDINYTLSVSYPKKVTLCQL